MLRSDVRFSPSLHRYTEDSLVSLQHSFPRADADKFERLVQDAVGDTEDMEQGTHVRVDLAPLILGQAELVVPRFPTVHGTDRMSAASVSAERRGSGENA